MKARRKFDFTHPYFAAGLGILVRTEPDGGVLATIGSLMTLQALGIVAGLLALLVVVGALIWLLERRRQDAQFDPRLLPGIGDGIWWAAVTMTTTGYGDKVPLGWRGRTLALVWMFASIFLVSLFSATLASSFVVGQLKTGVTGPADLPRVRVAVVSGTAGEEWSSLQGLTMRNYPFVIQASKALQRGDVQALVHERAILGHMVKEYGWRELQILPHTLAVRDYAIALPQGSALKEPINRALLKVVHRPAWKDTVQKLCRRGQRLVRTPVSVMHLSFAVLNQIRDRLNAQTKEQCRENSRGTCIAALLLAGASACAARAQEVAGNAAVSGAGSTFAFPIIAKWAAGYQRWKAGGGDYQVSGGGLDDAPTGRAVDYEPSGSLAGTLARARRLGRLRRLRRAAEFRRARKARARPVSDRDRRRRHRGQSRRRRCRRHQVHRPTARRHLPRQGVRAGAIRRSRRSIRP